MTFRDAYNEIFDISLTRLGAFDEDSIDLDKNDLPIDLRGECEPYFYYRKIKKIDFVRAKRNLDRLIDYLNTIIYTDEEWNDMSSFIKEQYSCCVNSIVWNDNIHKIGINSTVENSEQCFVLYLALNFASPCDISCESDDTDHIIAHYYRKLILTTLPI